jgi:hypothetical protein
MSEYSEASEDDDDDSSEEMGSEEESGKDWSDLEREAAEEDREREIHGNDKSRPKHKSSHKSSRYDSIPLFSITRQIMRLFGPLKKNFPLIPHSILLF